MTVKEDWEAIQACPTAANRAALLGRTDLLATDETDMSVLCHAARAGNANLFQEVLRAVPEAAGGPKLNGERPLLIAAAAGRTEIVRMLLTGNIRQRMEFRIDALALASAGGHHQTVALLAPRTAVNALNSTGVTALEIAAGDGDIKMAWILRANRAVVSRNHDTAALIKAAESGQTDIVRLLVSPTNVNLIDDEGNTALIVAAREGHTATVEALLDAGARHDLVSNAGFTALSAATFNGRADAAGLLVRCRPDSLNGPQGMDSLVNAAAAGELDMVKSWVATGASFDSGNTAASAALAYAAYIGRSDVVRLLLDAGVDANTPDSAGVTALMLAAHYGHTYVVEMLASSGADVHHQDPEGRSPLWLAQQNGHAEIERIFPYLALNQALGADADLKKSLSCPKSSALYSADEDAMSPCISASGHTFSRSTVDTALLNPATLKEWGEPAPGPNVRMQAVMRALIDAHAGGNLVDAVAAAATVANVQWRTLQPGERDMGLQNFRKHAERFMAPHIAAANASAARADGRNMSPDFRGFLRPSRPAPGAPVPVPRAARSRQPSR